MLGVLSSLSDGDFRKSGEKSKTGLRSQRERAWTALKKFGCSGRWELRGHGGCGESVGVSGLLHKLTFIKDPTAFVYVGFSYGQHTVYQKLRSLKCIY